MPNIVLIFLDDLGIGDVRCYGGDIQTPHIDTLARSGLKFSHFYASSAVCTPSRYGLLTGRYPVRAPAEFLGPLMGALPEHQNAHLDPGEVTIAELLKQSGYQTALIGKWHLGHGSPDFGPNSHGFDYFYGFLPGCIDYYLHTYQSTPALYRNRELIQEEGYFTDLATNEAVRFIERSKSDPFFLYLAHAAPHYGKTPAGDILQAPASFRDAHPDADDRDTYSAIVQSADDGIGRILDTLERNGLKENTIVLFLSDNGGSLNYGGNNGRFAGQKNTLWEGGIRVPCLMCWPGSITPGSTTGQVATNVDLLPTLMTILGQPLPDRVLDGIDLSPILLEGAGAKDRQILFRLQHQEALISGYWKYLRENRDGKFYLFDLAVDPYEQKDLATAMPGKARELATAYFNILASTGS